MKEKIIPVVSIVVGLIAFFLTAQYFRSRLAEIERQRAALMAGMRQIKVFVATRDIPGGTTIAASDVRPDMIPEISAPDDVVLEKEGLQLLGKKTLYPISAKKPIQWSNIEGELPPPEGLSSSVHPGMRAVSIPVSGASAVSGMIAPNDRVDVLGTFTVQRPNGEMETETRTLLQDVTVLATGQTLAKQMTLRGRSQPRSSGYNSVTLEVTPREAEFLVFAQQMQGRLTLTLRHPSDVSYESNLPEVNMKYVDDKVQEMNQYRQQKIRRKTGL